jgi:hypothetical protein
MEPHRKDQHKTLEPSAGRKPKRFRIVKLEERIAPGHGHGGGHKTDFCNVTAPCSLQCTNTWDCTYAC